MSSFSRVSAVSAISRVPDLQPFELMNIANSIYSNRRAISDMIMGKKCGSLQLRDIVSSSQILKICARVGMQVNIGELKALLKDMGLNWNGHVCSMTQLLMKIKEYLNAHLT